MTAPEPADLARQHGAPWAKQSIEDELMRMEQIDYSDLPDANLPPPNWEWRVYKVVCIALFLAVLVVVWMSV